ncbi:MAG: hypothetical protein Q7R73_00110 [bacterium]|nr:hypothetical protein [bacterium]
MKDSPETKIQILEALKSTPIVSVACAKTGIARATYYRWHNDDLEFKKRVKRAMRSGNKNINDLVFGKLIQKTKEGNLGAIMYYLSHRHPYFKKKDKVKVEVTQKDSPIHGIPESAFNEVLISKLPKRLRKQVVRKARRIHEIVREHFDRVNRENPGLGPIDPKEILLRDTLPWGLILKDLLEEERKK